MVKRQFPRSPTSWLQYDEHYPALCECFDQPRLQMDEGWVEEY